MKKMKGKIVIRYAARPTFERMPVLASAYNNRQPILTPLEQVSASEPVNINLLSDLDSAIESAERLTAQGFESAIYKITIERMRE